MARDSTQCSEGPAAASFDPTASFPNAALQRVCGKLLLAQLSDRTGLFLIVGKAGMGKSALLAKILAQSPADDCCVGLSGQPDMSCKALLDLWSARLGIPGKACDEEARLAELREFLSALLGRGAASALWLDDAQTLQNEVLEKLCKISQWQQKGRKLVRIILAGRPELATRLDRPELSQIKQAIAFYAELGPLQEAEVAAYIEHRLHVAGYCGSDMFSADAVASIARASEGVPRWINVLCRSAVLIAKRQSQKTVSLEVADLARRECADLLRQPSFGGDPCEDDAEEVAQQACPAHDWPWSVAGEAIADETTSMLRPLFPSSEVGPRPLHRIEKVARAGAALLAGLAISAAAASFYMDRSRHPGPPAVEALSMPDDQSPPTQIAIETARPRLPDVRTAVLPAGSVGQPETVVSMAAEAVSDGTVSPPSKEDVAGSQPESLAGMTTEAVSDGTMSPPSPAGDAAAERLPDPADRDAPGQQGSPVALQIIAAHAGPDGTVPGAPLKDGVVGSARIRSVVDEAVTIFFKPLAWRAEDALPTATDVPGPVPVQATQTWSGPSVEQLIARGDELLALGDIASARLFYELAANGGSAEAAARVGMTYDPLYLKGRGVFGAAANAEKAIEWYISAIDGGYARAIVRLDGLVAYLKGRVSRFAGRATPGGSETSPEAELTADRQEPEAVIDTEPSTANSRRAGLPEETAGGTAVEADTEVLRIQLAALKSKDAATKEGLRLRAMHRELFGDKDLAVERLDLSGGRGVMFGVQIGPFPDWVSATGACTKLKAKKQDCFVVAPY